MAAAVPPLVRHRDDAPPRVRIRTSRGGQPMELNAEGERRGSVPTFGGRRFPVSPIQLAWGSVIVFELGFIAFLFVASLSNDKFAIDYTWHMEASQRLLDTGSPYHAYQLQGPYSIEQAPILYPPTAFALFVPFLWLPPVLWWVLPLALLVFCMTRHRPPIWAWAATLAGFCWPLSMAVYVHGNPAMWIVAFVAAGTVWAWPFVAVLLKPAVPPAGLLGANRRSWGIALAALVAASLAFGHLWIDWVAAIRNSDVTFAYNFSTIPLMVAPLIPWLADRRHPIHARIREGRQARRL